MIVAVGHEALALQSDEIGDGDGIAHLHVLGAAAIVIPVLFHEFEWIGGPVLAPRLHHVQMSDDQYRP